MDLLNMANRAQINEFYKCKISVQYLQIIPSRPRKKQWDKKINTVKISTRKPECELFFLVPNFDPKTQFI